jgi:hypothetical protein
MCPRAQISQSTKKAPNFREFLFHALGRINSRPMRQDPPDGIMPMLERTGTRRGFAGRKEEDTYAPLRDSSELD